MTELNKSIVINGNGGNGHSNLYLKFLKEKGIKLIGIAYSAADRQFFPTEEAFLAEQEVFERAKSIQVLLSNLGFDAKLYPGDEHLLQAINNDKPDLILNLVDAVRGLEFLGTCIPASFDLAQIPYTGSGMYSFILSSNKMLMKEVLLENDIPTPRYQLVRRIREPISKRLRYPLISKLNNYNGSVGLTNDSVSDNEKQLRKRFSYLFWTYSSPVILEEFIQGRELSIIVIEGDKKSVYVGEKVFNPSKKRKYDFCSYEATWIEEDAFYYRKANGRARKVVELAKKAFDLLDMSDYAKFDVRISKNGRPYFIDCNPNPTLGPYDCAIRNITKMHDVSFSSVLLRILKNSLKTSKYGHGCTR